MSFLTLNKKTKLLINPPNRILSFDRKTLLSNPINMKRDKQLFVANMLLWAINLITEFIYFIIYYWLFDCFSNKYWTLNEASELHNYLLIMYIKIIIIDSRQQSEMSSWSVYHFIKMSEVIKTSKDWKIDLVAVSWKSLKHTFVFAPKF